MVGSVADVSFSAYLQEVYGANASDYESSEDEDWGKKKQSRDVKKSAGGTDGSVLEKRRKVKDGQDLEGVSASQGRKSSTRLPKEVVTVFSFILMSMLIQQKNTRMHAHSLSFDVLNTHAHKCICI